MAAFAYVLLPASGIVAFFSQTSARVRFHGAQAVTLGFVWPLLLFGGSTLSPTATWVAFVAGAVVWLMLIVTTATGRDVRLPLAGSLCARAAGLEDRS